MRLLLRYLRPQARVAAAALVCAALNQLLLLLDPLILRRIVDAYAPNAVAGQSMFQAQVGWLLLAGVAATFLAWVANELPD